MNRQIILLTAVLSYFTPFIGLSGPHYQHGEVYSITSSSAGLMIRLKVGNDLNVVPDNCIDTNKYGWMIIKEENQTMIAVALSMQAQNKKMATIYTQKVGSYCVVTQYDPAT